MAEQQQEQEKQPEMLVPLDTYLKAGFHIGTKFRTKYMDSFIYKVRPDGLTVLNVQEINKRLGIAMRFISQYDAEDIIVVGKRENGWKSLRMFSKMTGIKIYAGRYHPGILTNSTLEDFREAKLLIATDPWPDKDAIKDGVKTGVAVVALCDTNNESNYVDLVVPCNNKGKKSLGLFFWLLAREFLLAKELIKTEKEMEFSVEDFMAD